MFRTLALVAALAGALLVGWLGTKTPDPEGGGQAATDFSTARAMADVRAIAREPHPGGSAANRRVADYLLARMTQLGLSPEIQSGMGVSARRWGGELWLAAGGVRNIVGVLPGRDRSKPALALMAHYDSVPASPGAADDAAGVAVALDVVRAIKARGTPERDVIVILTDGEETGLLGAGRFFFDHPLRERVGLIINLEARGGGGRANMFQTGPHNGALIRAFARTAVAPVSNSLAVFLYENMPNDTDFTVSKEAGVPGLNFAFIGRQFDYHSATSTAANLDQGSVRHMGEQALAASAAFAFADALPGKAADAVYSQTFGDHVLAYPAWGGWIVLAIVAALLAVAVVRARRARALTLPDVGRGGGGALFVLLAGALLLTVARKATGVGFGYVEQRALLAQWGPWEAAMEALGVGLLVLVPALLARGGTAVWLAGAAALLGGLAQLGGWDPIAGGLGLGAAVVALIAFRRPTALPGAWLGVLLTGAAAALALQAALPAVAFLVAWPLALAALGAAVGELGARADASRTGALVLLAVAGGGWLAVFFHGVAQGLDLPMMLALFLWLGALLAWPLAAAKAATPVTLAPAIGPLALGLALLGVVRFADPWSERHPLATMVFHVQDQDGRRALVSTAPSLDPWTRRLFQGAGPVARRDMRPLGRGEVWAADLPGRGEPAAPPVAAERLPDGRVALTLPAARVVALDLRVKGGLRGLVLNDVPVAERPGPGEWMRVSVRGEPGESRLLLSPEGPGSLEVRYAVFEEAWPAGAAPLPARPKDVMAFDLSDSAVSTGTVRFAW